MQYKNLKQIKNYINIIFLFFFQLIRWFVNFFIFILIDFNLI
jgi:hypothetical protein